MNEYREINPEHLPVSEETKDDFILMMYELTKDSSYYKKFPKEGIQKDDFIMYSDDVAKYIHLDYEHKLRPKSDNIKAQLLVEIEDNDSPNIMHQTFWRIGHDGTFLKYKRDWEEKEEDYKLPDDPEVRFETIQKKISALEKEIKVAEKNKKLGITIATEAEAREAIEILKQIKEQEENKKAS